MTVKSTNSTDREICRDLVRQILNTVRAAKNMPMLPKRETKEIN